MPLPTSLSLVYHARERYPREIPLETVYRDVDIQPRPGRPAVILNMVQTLDGVVAIDGKAWTIGSEVDHYLFRTLRGWADVVLSGAGTLRLNDVVPRTLPDLQAVRIAAGRPANPAAVVLSRRADFPDDVLRKRFFSERDFASIIMTTEMVRETDRRRLEAAGAEVWVVPAGSDGEIDLEAAFGLFADRGIERVLAEGGPVTNRRLVAAHLLDELFLTLTPRVAPTADPARIVTGLLGGGQAGFELISELQYRAPDLREWYLRFAVVPSGTPEIGGE